MDGGRAELPFFDAPAQSEPRPMRRKPKHYGRRDDILRAKLTSAEKGLLHAVLAHMGFDDDRGERACRASAWRLAVEASISEDTVSRAVKSLEALGVLRVQRDPRKPSKLTINFSRLKALADPRLAPGHKRPTKGTTP